MQSRHVDESPNARAQPARRARNAGIVVIALAAAVGLFVLLADGDGDALVPAPLLPPSAQEAGARSQAPSGTAAPRREEPAIAGIVVRDGKPVGGVARLEFRSGERVRFTVRSDTADEVHVHGFDIVRRVPANGSVRFAFPAEIEGVFEVELEGAHVQIAQLRIVP